MAPYFEDAVHSLKGKKNVIDIRNMGLVAGIELESRPGAAGERATEIFKRCFDKGVLIRVTADIIALSPPLIVEKGHVDQILETVTEAIDAVA